MASRQIEQGGAPALPTFDRPPADDAAPRPKWDQRLRTFTALRILFEADDRWGPLHQATSVVEITSRSKTPTIRAEYDAAEHKHQRELARHMDTIYNPLIEAGLALVHTPAPDLAAVQVKHEVCNADGFRLLDYQDEDDELFGIIRADIKRLTGVEA